MITIFFTDEENAKPDPVATLRKMLNLYLNETDQHPTIKAKREFAEQLNKVVRMIK